MNNTKTNQNWQPVLTILTDAHTTRHYSFGEKAVARISFEIQIEDDRTTRDYRCRAYGPGGEVEADHFVRDDLRGRAAIHFAGFVNIRSEGKLRVTRVEVDRADNHFRRNKRETVVLAHRFVAVELDAGDLMTLKINQGSREAEVLAVIGDDALVEYTMPAGTSALHIMSRKTSRGERSAHGGGTSISYAKLPIRWIKAAAATAGVWVANPQSGDRYPEDIADALAFRAEKKAAAKAAKAERQRRAAEWRAKHDDLT